MLRCQRGRPWPGSGDPPEGRHPQPGRGPRQREAERPHGPFGSSPGTGALPPARVHRPQAALSNAAPRAVARDGVGAFPSRRESLPGRQGVCERGGERGSERGCGERGAVASASPREAGGRAASAGAWLALCRWPGRPALLAGRHGGLEEGVERGCPCSGCAAGKPGCLGLTDGFVPPEANVNRPLSIPAPTGASRQASASVCCLVPWWEFMFCTDAVALCFHPEGKL